MKKSILTIIVLAIVVGAGWHFYTKNNSQSANGKMPPATVEVATVSQRAIPLRLTAVGSLEANDAVDISPQIAGQVAKISFTPGQRVKKGTPLIQLDDTIYQAQLAAAQADLDLSALNYKRAAILEKKHLEAKQSLDTATADLQEKKTNLAVKQAELDKMILSAPFDGVVGVRQISVGDFVNVGQGILSIVDTHTLLVDYKVPEIYKAQLKIGQPVELTTSAFADKVFKGKVSFVSPTIDKETRTILIQATVDNTDGKLSPGMFADVTQTLGEDAKALVIPLESLQPSIEGQLVYKIVNNKAESTNVTIGTRTNKYAQVLKGLKEGDIVVTAGQQKLKDGAPVKIVK